MGKGQSWEGVGVSKKLSFLGRHPAQPPPQREAGLGRVMPVQGLLNAPFVWSGGVAGTETPLIRVQGIMRDSGSGS